MTNTKFATSIGSPQSPNVPSVQKMPAAIGSSVTSTSSIRPSSRKIRNAFITATSTPNTGNARRATCVISSDKAALLSSSAFGTAVFTAARSWRNFSVSATFTSVVR